MSSVMCFKRIWGRVNRKLCTWGDRKVWKHEIAVVSGGIGLDATKNALLEVRRLRDVPEEQFVRAINIFDSSPDVVAIRESQRGLRQIAVPRQAIRIVIAPPKQGASPIPATGRTVVH